MTVTCYHAESLGKCLLTPLIDSALRYNSKEEAVKRLIQLRAQFRERQYVLKKIIDTTNMI